jgi:hypothetical protein
MRPVGADPAVSCTVLAISPVAMSFLTAAAIVVDGT